ncbi:hypothetical protein [Nannocystis pusilla]|uniref:hypothetical protein n=1 Tax=Nannocystis pusilla TaxID=889268 RepID=UPI003B77E456
MVEYDFGLAPEPTTNIPPADGEDPTPSRASCPAPRRCSTDSCAPAWSRPTATGPATPSERQRAAAARGLGPRRRSMASSAGRCSWPSPSTR